MSYERVEYFDSSTLVANAIHLWLFCLIAFSSLIPITSPKVLFPAFSSCFSLLYQWRDGYKQVRPILSTLGASFASIWFFVFLKLLLKVKKCDAALSQMFLWIKIKEETFRPLNIDFTHKYCIFSIKFPVRHSYLFIFKLSLLTEVTCE